MMSETATALSEKLLPCPFCGSRELMMFCDPAEGRDNSGPSRRIQCAGCHIEAPFYDAEALAIEAWNTRTAAEGWRPIESAPRDGTLFLAWQIVPTEDYDTGRVTDECSPCIAQSVFGAVGSIPLHYVPKGQRITHWRPLPAPPTGEGGGL